MLKVHDVGMMNITTNSNVTVDDNAEESVFLRKTLGLVSSIVVVVLMFGILLLSFYNFHRRLQQKKKHHLDYIKANLPLKRPRISPPNMSSLNAFEAKTRNTENVTKLYPNYKYKSIPTEELCEFDAVDPENIDINTFHMDSNLSNDPHNTGVHTSQCQPIERNSKYKRLFDPNFKTNDKYYRYPFELLPSICRPESSYIPGDIIDSTEM